MIGGYGAAAYVEGAGLMQSLYFILVAFVLFLFMAWLVTKTFTLCHELPDKVFEWVGGAPSLGDQEMLDEGRQFLGGLVSRGSSIRPARAKPAASAEPSGGGNSGKAPADEKAAQARAEATAEFRRGSRSSTGAIDYSAASACLILRPSTTTPSV